MTINIHDLFDCHVINLARSPERLASFLAQNEATGMRFDRFDAIEGVTLDAAVTAGIIKAAALFKEGAIGNAMSHRAIWRETVVRRKSALVFEDDAVIRYDIGTALPPLVSQLDAYDIILLGYNTDSVLDVKLWDGGLDLRAGFWALYPTADQLIAFAHSKVAVGLYKLNNAFGVCGYAISPKGAERLLSICFPMDNRIIPIPALRRKIPSVAIDCMLNAFYGQMSAYACLAPLVMPINDRAASSVQN